MVKPSEVPVVVPEMDTLTPEQETTIQLLLSKLDDAFAGGMPYYLAREDTPERRRLFAYKVLKARKWKLTHAMEMVDKTIAFRAENGIDKWKLFPSAFPLRGYDEAKVCAMLAAMPGGDGLFPREGVSEVDRCYRAFQVSYVNVYHYWDKEGHPVLYDCCGRAEVSQILRDLAAFTPANKPLADVIVPYHTYMNEVQYYLIRYANQVAKEAGRHGIMDITVVVDMEGLSFKVVQMRFIKIIRAIFEVDQAYYPEVLHRLFIINAPSFFHVAYDWVKGSLDENTRRKLVFSANKEEATEMLLRVIDADKLPCELGGTCQCEGGCLPRYSSKSTAGEATHREVSEVGSHSSLNDVQAQGETIKRGRDFVQTRVVGAGDEVTWEFAVDGAREVLFSAVFAPTQRQHSTATVSSSGTSTTTPTTRTRDSGEVSTRQLIKEAKLSVDVDTFVATTNGTLILTWSNKGAWVHSRSIQYRVQHHKHCA